MPYPLALISPTNAPCSGAHSNFSSASSLTTSIDPWLPCSYRTKDLNLHVFVFGETGLIPKFSEILAIAMLDTFVENYINHVFNQLSGFKVYIAAKNSPLISTWKHTPGFRAAFHMSRRVVLIDPREIINYGLENQILLDTIRHEFLHAYIETLYQNSLNHLSHLTFKSKTALIPFSPTQATQLVDHTKKIEIFMEEIFKGKKNIPKDINDKFLKISTLEQKKSWEKQGYFIIEATANSLAAIFGPVAPTSLTHKQESSRYKGAIFYKRSESTGSIKLPISIKNIAFIIFYIIFDVAESYAPEKDKWLYLSELQAHLHAALPYTILNIFLPEFLKKFKEVEDKLRPINPPSVDYFAPALSVKDIIINNSFLCFQGNQIFAALQAVSYSPTEFDEKLLDTAIEQLDTLIKIGANTRLAHLYSARLYYHKKSYQKVASHYKQAFKNQPKIPKDLSYIDLLRYIETLEILAHKEQQIQYIHTAIVLIRKINSIFNEERPDTIELAKYLENLKLKLNHYRQQGIAVE